MTAEVIYKQTGSFTHSIVHQKRGAKALESGASAQKDFTGVAVARPQAAVSIFRKQGLNVFNAALRDPFSRRPIVLAH